MLTNLNLNQELQLKQLLSPHSQILRKPDPAVSQVFFFFFFKPKTKKGHLPQHLQSWRSGRNRKYFQFHFNKQKKLPSLTVLIWREGSSINVDVGVYFDGRHVEATGFENGSHTTGNDAFTNTRNDSTCDQDVLHSGGES